MFVVIEALSAFLSGSLTVGELTPGLSGHSLRPNQKKRAVEFSARHRSSLARICLAVPRLAGSPGQQNSMIDRLTIDQHRQALA